MKRTLLAAMALALLPFPGKADDDSSGNGFDRAIRRSHTGLTDVAKADLMEYLISL